jgi:GNAT superfamily N-acetyltransferase
VTDRFVVEPLSGRHERSPFDCGVIELDRYLKQQASQDMRRRISNCFVAVRDGENEVAGYYTLAASGIPLAECPPALARKLPRYPLLPAVLIGRLAVDTRSAGRSLGSALLYDAIKRCAGTDSAVFALIVDAKDEKAANFYRHFGFQAFADRPLSLHLPMATATKLMAEE